MTDITLTPITTGYNVSTINNNFDTIEEAINEDVLHRSGGNNTMAQELDMDSNKIINVETDKDIPHSAANVKFVLDHLSSDQINLNNVLADVEILKNNVQDITIVDISEGDLTLTAEQSQSSVLIFTNFNGGELTYTVTMADSVGIPSVSFLHNTLNSNAQVIVYYPAADTYLTAQPGDIFRVFYFGNSVIPVRVPVVGNPITPNTATKIQYNSDGIIVGGEAATTADITDSVDKRYVTDAQLAAIGVGGGSLDTSMVDPSTDRNYVTDAEKAVITGIGTTLTTADVPPSTNRNYVTDSQLADIVAGSSLVHFTPTLQYDSGLGSPVVLDADGFYTINGNTATFAVNFELSAKNAGTGSDVLQVRGFPFSRTNNADCPIRGSVLVSNPDHTNWQFAMLRDGSGTYVSFVTSTLTAVSRNDITNTTIMSFTGVALLD